MYGLTVRWSLRDAPAGTAAALREYVRETSVPRFTGMPGLVQKTWQMTDRGFFSGVYVWSSESARAGFLEQFRANPSPVSALVGTGPELVQEWDLVGVAVGGDGPLPPSQQPPA
jgi:hypothetical protein